MNTDGRHQNGLLCEKRSLNEHSTLAEIREFFGERERKRLMEERMATQKARCLEAPGKSVGRTPEGAMSGDAERVKADAANGNIAGPAQLRLKL